MAPFFQKPENAVKRAEELIAVSQHATALSLLHETILSKRARSSPLQVLEPIMLKFVELSVSLGKGKLAREALYQYKNIVQNVNVVTIELVIKRFLTLSEEKLTEAQAKAVKINLDAVEDLEASETPESILMSTVSTDVSKDRTDRAVVTPWLRFLWEAFRTALDTLRNNARLEILYQHVASQAFGFCLKYARKTEFRRLCEILRQHLASATKYAGQSYAVDLNDPDTLQRHLDTRFVQLAAAIELEHWQEGFRSIEDIHNLIEFAKRSPKPKTMATYYEKLAKILMVGDNYLFHAAALNKHFSVMRLNKNLPAEEVERLASNVLIATLAIPIIRTANREASEGDEVKPRILRLTALLRSTQVPTRESLLKEALSKSVFPFVRPEIQQLYRVLEVDFHPLTVCKKISPIIASLDESNDLKPYAKLLQQVTLTRLLQQLSQVYSTIKIDEIVKLAALPEPYNFSAHDIEKFIMSGCKRNEFSIRINHQTQTIKFEMDMFASSTGLLSDGPRIQTLPADHLRLQLVNLAKRLSNAIGFIDPSVLEKLAQAQSNAFQAAKDHLDEEHRATAIRRALIEKKKEMRETQALQKEREELLLKQQRQAQELAAEKIRLEEEAKEREAARYKQMQEEVEKKSAQDLAKNLAAQLREGNVEFDENELLNMDKNKLIEMQVQQLEKERRELMNKVKAIAKRIDHTERAMRKEEIPMLKKDFEEQQKRDREAYETAKKMRYEEAERQHRENMTIKASVARMIGDYHELYSELQAKREEELREQREVAAKKIEAAKEKRIKEYSERFRADRERLAAEAAERAKKEEEERIRREREAKEAEAKKKAEEQRRAEQEEYKRKMDEIARKQREREAEIEERRRREEEEKRAKGGRHVVGSIRPAPPTAPITADEPKSWRTQSAATASAASTQPAAATTAASTPSSAQPGEKYRPPQRASAVPPSGPGYGQSRGTTGSSSPFGSARPVNTAGGSFASSSSASATSATATAEIDPRFKSKGPPRFGEGKWRQNASAGGSNQPSENHRQ